MPQPASEESRLFEQYGPLISGHDLAHVVGFRTFQGFSMAAKRGNLGFKIFQIPGRRGRFAKTTDVAVWLESVSKG